MPTTSRPLIRSELLARLLVGAVVLAVVLVGAVVLLGGGSDEVPPATGAAAVVPGDALAYVHVSIDPTRPAVKRALALAARFPGYARISGGVLARLDGLAGGGAAVDFSRQIRPWLGKEAALAVLNTAGSTAGTLVVLDVSDQARARAFLSKSGASPSGSYRGVTLYRYAAGDELAFVSHYLLQGQDASVRAAIDVTSKNGSPLQSSHTFTSAAAGEPADRVIDAYASAAGVRRLLAPRSGAIGALGALLYQPALTGVTISVSSAPGGARVRVHSALDPTLARLNGTGVGTFTPSLQSVMPSGSTVLLDVTALSREAPRVLGALAAGGIAGRVGPLLRRLGAALGSEGVDVPQIVSLFGAETAVAIVPHDRSPALVVVARTDDEARARSMLAALELPLEQLFPPASSGPGSAPLFGDQQVAGVTAHELTLTPGLHLDYAVFDGLVVVSTSLDGIAAVARHTRALADDPGYRATLAAGPSRVTSLLFLDFSQLLNLGEQTGLTRGAQYRALAPDLRKIRAVGLSSTSGEADSTAELFLQIP